MTKSYNSGPIMTDEQPSRTNSMYLRTEGNEVITSNSNRALQSRISRKQKNNTANVVHYALNSMVL